MQTSIDRIWRHLEFIASEPRYAETDRLEVCRQYCEQQLAAVGWKVARRSFTAIGSAGQSLNGINLVCCQKPEARQRPRFVLGAHLDSREETPGADDNASAVAVLLETARLVVEKNILNSDAAHAVELELVVFDLEEHGMLGGAFHAESCLAEQQDVCGMVSLEMLGYCSHAPGSQQFPPELADRFPDQGNFIGVVGNQKSAALIQNFCSAFQAVNDLPCEFLQVPDNGVYLPATRLSDHSPFWDAGFPAIMVTDTSFMRNPNYHLPSDTVDTLDRDFLHKVAEGVLLATEEIVRHGLPA